MIDDSEFDSFVFCLAHKRVSSSLLKDHQDLVCHGFKNFTFRFVCVFTDNVSNKSVLNLVPRLSTWCYMHLLLSAGLQAPAGDIDR